MKAEIKSVGSYLPKKILSNEEIIRIKNIDTTEEFISERFGVKTRRKIEGEKTSDLGAESTKKALEKANLSKKDLDAIVVATMTPDQECPSTACIIQDKLGLTGIPAFDVSAACSGFVYAMDVVVRMLGNQLENDNYRNIALVSCEAMSKVLDYSDRAVCPIFGDASSTVIFSKSDKDKVYASYLYADGSGSKLLSIPENDKYLRMDGKEVYGFAVTLFPKIVNETLKKAKMDLGDVDWIFPHQANVNIIREGLKRLGLGMDKTFLNMDKFGNTAAASIPLAMDEAIELGKVKRGQLLLCVGFGAGWTGGGILLEF